MNAFLLCGCHHHRNSRCTAVVCLLAFIAIGQTLHFIHDILQIEYRFQQEFDDDCGRLRPRRSSLSSGPSPTPSPENDGKYVPKVKDSSSAEPEPEGSGSDDLPDFLKRIPKTPKTNTKVGICTMLRGSESYLDEWIDYHLLAVDFREIFILDNSKEFLLEDWAQKRNKKTSNVHVIHYPDTPKMGRGGTMQLQGMDECTRKFGSRVDAMMYLDDDEFLVLYHHRTVGDYVSEYLLPNTTLSVNWKVFGTGNHTSYSPQPALKRFVHRFAQADQRAKPICRPQDFRHMATPHSVYIREIGKDGWRNANGKKGEFSPDGSQSRTIATDVAAIHHYKYKSQQEWDHKSCQRKDISATKMKNCGIVPATGDVLDDSAWQLFKSRVPKYAYFDTWEDFF